LGAGLLVAVAFLVGGLFGAAVMVIVLRADRSSPGGATALAALGAAVLLALAGVFTVLGGLPLASELTPAFASDRGLAAAAALAAAVCALFSVVALARAEREARPAPAVPMDWQSLTAIGAVVAGGVALGALALGVRVASAPEALRPDFAELVTNLRLGNGYARGVAPALDATALHPPLAPFVAAIFPGIVDHVHVVVSALVVLVTAGLGGRLGGIRGAIGAGLMAALLPSMWGQQLPEALAALGVASALLFAWPEKASVPSAALAGACLGLAALARPEAIVAAPIVVVWMALRTRWNASPVIACAVAAVALMGPWLLWTQDQFGVLQPSTSLGATLAGANAESTTRGARIGELAPLPPPPPGTDEGFLDGTRRRAAIERFWTGRMPVVIAARVGRAWDLWWPASVHDARTARGLTTPGGSPGVVLEAGTSLVLMAWLWARRRDWRRLFPFYAMPAAFTLVSAATFGSRDVRSWTAPLAAAVVGLFLAELARRGEGPVAVPPS
jgi:hypothetical protein